MILPGESYAALIGEHRRTLLERAGSVFLGAAAGIAAIGAGWASRQELRDFTGVLAAGLLTLGGLVAVILFCRKGAARTNITLDGIEHQGWFVPTADIDHLELEPTTHELLLVVITKNGDRRRLELTRSMENALRAISAAKEKDRPACGRSFLLKGD